MASSRRSRNAARKLEEDETKQVEETSFITESREDAKNSRRRSRAARNINEGQENAAFEEDNEETKTPSSEPTTSDKAKKSRRRGKRSEEEEVKEPEEEPADKDPNILAVIVHQSDKLRTDINMYHPMVRVHILDLDMDGNYVRKLDKDRNCLMYYEKDNRKSEYVTPILTTPYDFKTNRSIIPKWEEILVFNEPFSRFTRSKPNCLLMFEIIDAARSVDSSRPQHQYTSQDTKLTWNRIAWGFLKLLGTNKILNTEKKIRLQLYYSPNQYKNDTSDMLVPEIYTLYKNGPRLKYPASLHVTVKSILPPGSFEPGIRSLYSINTHQISESNENQGKQNASDIEQTADEIEATKGAKSKDIDSVTNSKGNLRNTSAIWSRVAGLPCRVPNDLTLKIKSTKNGCYSVKFSSTGSYLACACVDEGTASPIYIYKIPSGNLHMKIQGHLGLIYEMSWSKNDKYLVTASNDATARVIDVETRAKVPFKILPHPNFLYTAKFHPNSSDVIVTSGYDKVLRVWTITNKRKMNQKYGQLMQELFGHQGYVNSSCFSQDGTTLYSADSVGKIIAWNCNSTQGDSFSEWSMKEEILVAELNNQCINQIELHPNQFRMLVHLRENEIKLIDLRLQAVVKRYKSSYNFQQNIKSAMTPCGTFLFCSGVDAKIYCWNIDTGDQVAKSSINLDYIKPARDIDFHPYDNMIALCSYDTYSPICVFNYNSDKATQDVHATNYLNSINRMSQQFEPADKEEFYDLPNQISDSNENKLKMKLADDVSKFNSFQSKRWQELQEKLDSVAPSSATGGVHRNLNANLAGKITISMDDHSQKPEFKYKGPKEVEDRVVVLYDYKAQRNDELDLAKGDELLVLVRENENWWMGEQVKNHMQGYFPANYIIDKNEREQAPPKHHVPLPKFTVKDAMKEIVGAKTKYSHDTPSPRQNYSPDFPKNKSDTPSPTVMSPRERHRKQLERPIRNTKANTSDDEIVKIKRENMLVSKILGKEKQDPYSESDNLLKKEIIDEINEIPTRDITSRRMRAKDNSKRHVFAHVIDGNPQTYSEA